MLDASRDPINFTSYRTMNMLWSGVPLVFYVPEDSASIFCRDEKTSKAWVSGTYRAHDEALRELRAQRQLVINLLR